MSPSEADIKPVAYHPDAVLFEFDAEAIEPEAVRDQPEAVSVQPDLASPRFEVVEVQVEPPPSGKEPADSWLELQVVEHEAAPVLEYADSVQPDVRPEPAASEPELEAAWREPVAVRPVVVTSGSEPVAVTPEPILSQPETLVGPAEPVASEPELEAARRESVAVQPVVVTFESEPVAVTPEPILCQPETLAGTAEPVVSEPELEASWRELVAVRPVVVTSESEPVSVTPDPIVSQPETLAVPEVPDESVAVPSDTLAVQPEPAPAVDAAEVLRKRVYAGFAATVAVGLALAGLYIGGRVFAKPASGSIDPATVKTVESAVPQAVATAAAPSNTAVPAAQGVRATPLSTPVPAAASVHAVLNFVTPQPGEKYLQLAALPPSFIDRYISELEAKGFHASVAPCPDENSRRILIGPFAERGALDKQRAVLEAAGIQPILRFY